MPDRYHDILVVDLLGGLGDLVLVLPVIHALARRNPGAALRVLTHQPGAQLLAADPAVTEVVWPDPADNSAERAAVARELTRRRPDLVVSTTRYDGIPELIERSGTRRWVTNLWRRPPPDEPVGQRYLRILAAEGLIDPTTPAPRIHLLPDEMDLARRTVAERLHPSSAPPVLLVPSAGMTVKLWPTRRWRELTGELRSRAVPVLASTPASPSPGDDLTDHLRAAGAHLLPPTGLRQMAARFAAVGRRGGVVVGPDTGPVRVATAVGTRAVALFGPTTAERYGLAPALARNLQGLPACPHRRPTSITEQVCWWEGRCPLSPASPSPGESACMADIDVPAVLAALGHPSALSVRPGGYPQGMGFQVNEVQRALRGADYPLDGEQLAELAKRNDARPDLIEELAKIDREVSGPTGVMQELKGELGGRTPGPHKSEQHEYKDVTEPHFQVNEVQKYLAGGDYPMDGPQLAALAERNDARPELVDALRGLRRVDGPNGVMKELKEHLGGEPEPH